VTCGPVTLPLHRRKSERGTSYFRSSDELGRARGPRASGPPPGASLVDWARCFFYRCHARTSRHGGIATIALDEPETRKRVGSAAGRAARRARRGPRRRRECAASQTFRRKRTVFSSGGTLRLRGRRPASAQASGQTRASRACFESRRSTSVAVRRGRHVTRGALGLALACDLVAQDTATFGTPAGRSTWASPS